MSRSTLGKPIVKLTNDALNTFLTTFLMTSKGVTECYCLRGIAVDFSCHNIPDQDVSFTTLTERYKKSLSTSKQKNRLQFNRVSDTTNPSKKFLPFNQRFKSTTKTKTVC